MDNKHVYKHARHIIDYNPNTYYIYPELCNTLYEMGCYKSFKVLQTGGSFKELIINGEKYIFRIKRSLNETEDGKLLEIILLSYINNQPNCGYIVINKTDNVARMNSINLHDKCLRKEVITDGLGSIITIVKHLGTLMITIMIKLCEQEKVKQIKLHDNSYITCDGGGNMQLKYLHTLTTGVPWYSKFSFVPESKAHLQIFKYNYNKMKDYLTSDLDIEHIFKKSIDIEKEEKSIADEIVKLFKANSSYKLHDIIREISKNSKYCNVFSKIYERIYDELKLKKYSGNLIMIKNYE